MFKGYLKIMNELLQNTYNVIPERMKGWSQSKKKKKKYPFVEVTGDRSNVQCCEEQY